MVSENAGDESFSCGWIVREGFPIPKVVRTCAGEQVRDSPESKDERGKRERTQSEPKPFDDFTEIVGTRDPLIKTTARNLVIGFARFS